MEILHTFPPNYDAICLFFPSVAENKYAVFAYDGVVYNPYCRELLPDLIAHEAVHMRQQVECGGAESWWFRYLTDASFRLEQEIEAYAEQYRFVMRAYDDERERVRSVPIGRNRFSSYTLDSMARALSSADYGTIISFDHAKSRIKNYS